jgi:hypothetical protein
MALLGSGCLRRPQRTPGTLVPARLQTQWKRKPQKGNTVNATELARNKFNALFADHDAEDTRAAARQQKPALKTVKKASTLKVKPQTTTDQQTLNSTS